MSLFISVTFVFLNSGADVSGCLSNVGLATDTANLVYAWSPETDAFEDARAILHRESQTYPFAQWPAQSDQGHTHWSLTSTKNKRVNRKPQNMSRIQETPLKRVDVLTEPTDILISLNVNKRSS